VVYEGAPELHDKQQIKAKSVVMDSLAVAAQ
jgi:hypothetical protein